MKNIIILSKKSMEKKVRQKSIDEKYAIISINDKDARTGENMRPARVIDKNDTNQIAVLQVFFGDINVPNLPDSMTLQQACDIYQFVDSIKDEIDTLFVHCHAGVSRSAGVAAALMHLFGLDDNQVWENMEYSPNMYCHKLIFDAAEVEYDETHWAEREQHQMYLWLEQFNKNN